MKNSFNFPAALVNEMNFHEHFLTPPIKIIQLTQRVKILSHEKCMEKYHNFIIVFLSSPARPTARRNIHVEFIKFLPFSFTINLEIFLMRLALRCN